MAATNYVEGQILSAAELNEDFGARPINAEVVLITGNEDNAMTGGLYLNGNPGATNQAANKAYVDTLVAGALTSNLISVALTVIAAGGDTDSDIIMASALQNILMLNVKCVNNGTNPNFTLELFDGNPAAAGVLIYQATGITEATFDDRASYFQPTPANGVIYAKVTNIDAVAMTATVSLRYLNVG